MKQRKQKNIITFKKKLSLQLFTSLIIVPFIFAYMSLMKQYNEVDMIIFLAGVLFVLTLVIINSAEPYIRIAGNTILINLESRNEPEKFSLADLKKVTRLSRRSVLLTFIHKKIEITLSGKNIDKLLTILEKDK